MHQWTADTPALKTDLGPFVLMFICTNQISEVNHDYHHFFVSWVLGHRGSGTSSSPHSWSLLLDVPQASKPFLLGLGMRFKVQCMASFAMEHLVVLWLRQPWLAQAVFHGPALDQRTQLKQRAAYLPV